MNKDEQNIYIYIYMWQNNNLSPHSYTYPIANNCILYMMAYSRSRKINICSECNILIFMVDVSPF